MIHADTEDIDPSSVASGATSNAAASSSILRLRAPVCPVAHLWTARLHVACTTTSASLFHVPSQELPRVLQQLHAALKPGGVLFSSNPHGQNEEGWNHRRYGAYHDLEAWRRYMSGAGFIEIEHYYRPTGLRREQQPWLASVWRRPPSGNIGSG